MKKIISILKFLAPIVMRFLIVHYMQKAFVKALEVSLESPKETEGSEFLPRRRAFNPFAELEDMDDLVFDKRVVAEQVLENMKELASRYKFATVSDLFDLLDIPTTYEHGTWGWTLDSLREVQVELEEMPDGSTMWKIPFPHFVDVR